MARLDLKPLEAGAATERFHPRWKAHATTGRALRFTHEIMGGGGAVEGYFLAVTIAMFGRLGSGADSSR